MNTAVEEYKRTRMLVANQIAQLAEHLKSLDAEQEKDPQNWGRILNLGQVHEGLEDTLAFITPEIEEGN